MIGLDTSAIIDIFKGEKKIKEFLDTNKEPLAITIISYLELFFGLNPEDKKHGNEAEYYREFFKRLYFVDLTKESCEKASKIYWNLKKRREIIDKFGCIISSIFIVNGINKILTRNPKHFTRLKELEVISY